ncbi:POTE ankyrin domain family member E, partial [Daubentonia madagascariensis]
QNDTQRQLYGGQNARLLQDGILNSHHCKHRETEIALKKMNSEISHSQEKEKNLLHKNHMFQEEIAMLRMERDTVKNLKQENEKKYLKDIEIAKEKNDNL